MNRVGDDYVARACQYALTRWNWKDEAVIRRLCESSWTAYGYPEQLVDVFAVRLGIKDPIDYPRS